MKNIAIVVAGLAVCLVAAAGCGAKTGAKTGDTYGSLPDADNTARNARDRDSSSVTPIDQKSNDADMKRTQDIRKSVVDAKLSTNATNVKIITANGVVTLRGPVKTESEREVIVRIARNVAGDANVIDEIEVESGR